jgi:hypothetical protein
MSQKHYASKEAHPSSLRDIERVQSSSDVFQVYFGLKVASQTQTERVDNLSISRVIK